MTRGSEPNCFEALVSCGAEAACFDTVFFRYLEHNAPADEDGPMIIRSWPEGDFERKLVVLWSGAAASGFARLWAACRADGVSVGHLAKAPGSLQASDWR